MWPEGMCGGGHAWHGGVHGGGACMAEGGMCSLLLHGFWDLISICSCSEFCIDQLQIPFGVQSTDATANGGLVPKPSESGWYPRRFL